MSNILGQHMFVDVVPEAMHQVRQSSTVLVEPVRHFPNVKYPYFVWYIIDDVSIREETHNINYTSHFSDVFSFQYHFTQNKDVT